VTRDGDYAVAAGRQLVQWWIRWLPWCRSCSAGANRPGDAGEDTARHDQLLAALDEIARMRREVGLAQAIRDVIRRHSPGPHRHEQLMALSGLSETEVSTALRALREAGLLGRGPPRAAARSGGFAPGSATGGP